MQAIFLTILQNDLETFLRLVEERESWLDELSEGLNNTVLHVATVHGRRRFVPEIIKLRPSLVSSRNASGDTPLHLAAIHRNIMIVMLMLETGLEVCSARNDKNETPLHLACRSNNFAAAKLIVEKTESVDLDELDLAISMGSISSGTVRIILERFPDLAREEAWMVEGGLPSTLLHNACDRGSRELTSLLLGLDQKLEDALNADGLSPLHLAVQRGSAEILYAFLDKSPLSFSNLTASKETVFHLATRSKNLDTFILMAESLGVTSEILLMQTDEDGNTVLHVAAYVACGALFISYIINKTIVDIKHKNKMGLEAYQLLPREAQDFELLSRWLRLDPENAEEPEPENIEEHPVPLHKPSDNRTNSHDYMVIRLLRQIEKNTSHIRREEKKMEREVERGRWNLEYEMHIEALQNARNTIAIVAVLIASVAYAGGINPPGGVYQDGPWKGKSMVGKKTAFKVFAICNNVALFTSLCIVILLVSIIPYKRKPLQRFLVATHRMMWVSVGFMATAYIAGSWVIIPHYHGTSWLLPAIVSIAGGALMALFSYLGVETIRHRSRKLKREGDIPSFAKTSSDLAASVASGYFTY